MIYKLLIKPVFFLFDPESVHNFALKFLSATGFLTPFYRLLFSYSSESGRQILLKDGRCFKNPVGLAAGFDKNGIAIRFWEAIGFSHIEVGTVTPFAQSGSERPRIFRLKKDEALINRLGFNNKGADEVKKNILEAKKLTGKDFIIGVNIGKNKDTPNEKAFEDYKKCFEMLFDCADYFTLNISSPNTPGLRELQSEKYLEELLKELQILNTKISKEKGVPAKDIFLKISPDISHEQAEVIFETVCRNELTGIIATNTTISRNYDMQDINQQGGLSGKPLKKLSNEILSVFNELKKKNNINIILIGVGGIFSKDDIEEKRKCGAELMQVYTGLIYKGPSILKNLLDK